MKSRGILTMAFGPAKYTEMAKSLARSLILHYPDVPRAIITDSNDPEIQELFTEKIDHRPEYGTNMRQKLYFDKYSPYEETLYIDSDSLVVRSLDHFWAAFNQVPFGVCESVVLRAGDIDEYGYVDVDFTLKQFGVESLTRFSGGLLYFNKSSEASSFFDTARGLLPKCAELRTPEFRGDGPNDEALYTMAMAVHGLKGTDFGDGGMWTSLDATGPLTVDIPQGICTFAGKGRTLNPDIMHFVNCTDGIQYIRECLKLKLLRDGEVNISPVQSLNLKLGTFGVWAPRKVNRVARQLSTLVKAKD